MGKQTRRVPHLSPYELAAQERIRQRNAEQAGQIPEPALPSTGTARIAALLAEVRRQRDEVFLAESSTDGDDLRIEADPAAEVDAHTEIELDRQIDLASNPFRPAHHDEDLLPPAG